MNKETKQMNPFKQAEIEAEEKRQKEQIRDIEIINYINNNNLFICTIEDGISKDELFEILIRIDINEQNIIQKIAPQLGVKYYALYEIYQAVQNKDIEKIKMIITIEKVEYDRETNKNPLQFMEKLIKIGSLVVNTFPLIALDIYYYIENDIAKKIKLRPGSLIDFSMEIVEHTANTDIEKALSILDIVEPHFKKDVLHRIIKKTNDKEIHNQIDKIIGQLN